MAKVGEYMRAGDDDPDIRVIVLTGVRRGLSEASVCALAAVGSREPIGRRKATVARWAKVS